MEKNLTRKQFCDKMNEWFSGNGTCLKCRPQDIKYGMSIELYIDDPILSEHSQVRLESAQLHGLLAAVEEIAGIKPILNNAQNIMMLWDNKTLYFTE